MVKAVFETLENTMVKGKNAGYENLFFFLSLTKTLDCVAQSYGLHFTSTVENVNKHCWFFQEIIGAILEVCP